MTEVISQLAFRTLTQDDYSFVRRTWMRSFGFGSILAKRIPQKVYVPRHGVIVDALLHRCITEIVCLKDDSATVLGFMTYEREKNYNVIHFMYIKRDFRRMGIGTALIANTKVDPQESLYTHKTRSNIWIDQKWDGLIYDPYLVHGDVLQ